MSNNFIHYNKRILKARVSIRDALDKNDLPFYADGHTNKSGLMRPEYHITKSISRIASSVKKGDTIWLIGQLYTPWGVLAPSLDAKISVKKVINKSIKFSQFPRESEFSLKYLADDSSNWLPIYDATETLCKLYTVNIRNKTKKLWANRKYKIGIYLQNMRQLKDANPLIELEERITSQGYDFVSYRHKDGTRLAFQKVKELCGLKIPVFFDRWSLPRRLAERREEIEHNALDFRIQRQIKNRNNRTVWAIESDGYGEPGSYSAIEKCLAIKLGKLKMS